MICRQNNVKLWICQHWFLLLLVFVALCSTGCEPEVQTGYGQASGWTYSGSVNGTVVFHEMLEAYDRKVHRYSQFSPRWDKYETVYWMPDNFKKPEQEVIDEIEDWLSERAYRTFVYVCRDYDASVQYWETLAERETDPVKADELNRLYLKSLANQFNNRGVFEREDCDWYQIKDYQYAKANKITGELVNYVDTANSDIRYASLAAPGDVVQRGAFGEYDAEVLMSVDSLPFIYRLTNKRFRNSQIIVVGNASFLLNLSLVNDTNREIAVSLIDYISDTETYGKNVLFIESGEFGLMISDRDSRDKFSQWNWITKKPMRYIVPNLLACFILLCFVYFPIFGRPKTFRKKSTTNFQDHIDALGQLIRKSKSVQAPNSWIEEYRRRTSRHRSKSPKPKQTDQETKET